MNGPISRREAIRVGGITLSLGAIIAACGENRGGDSAPGRVGNAPSVTEPPEYEIDDAVFLRTASSLEMTAVELYRTVLGLDLLDAGQVSLVERLIADHEATAQQMMDLTSDAGGTGYACPNTWIAERELAPVLAAIGESDQPLVDVFTLAISFENIAASTHQDLTARLTVPDLRVATATAAALSARHSAWLAIAAGGSDAHFSPALLGEEVTPTDTGVNPQFAIPTAFGSLGQIEVLVGPPDENDARQRFTLRTPAENALIYNELSPTC